MGLALGMSLKIYSSVAKALKIKVTESCGLIPTFLEVTRKKLVGGSFGPPPISLPPPPPPLPLSWVELKLSQNSQENTCARISSCKLPKLADRGCNFIKNETLAQVISCEFYDNLRTPILQNTSGRLLV